MKTDKLLVILQSRTESEQNYDILVVLSYNRYIVLFVNLGYSDLTSYFYFYRDYFYQYMGQQYQTVVIITSLFHNVD